MKYIPIEELNTTEQVDEGLYRLLPRETGGGELPAELFTEGDLFRARKGAPAGADAIAYDGDWKYWNSKTGAFLGDVFKD